jgi:hypothetical protein
LRDSLTSRRTPRSYALAPDCQGILANRPRTPVVQIPGKGSSWNKRPRVLRLRMPVPRGPALRPE